MILTCNSCNKKFIVPDKAITPSGRMVQCGSCGNKWKQFPSREVQKKPALPKIQSNKKREMLKPARTKKTAKKKVREISLYSPEYLAKKHGIKIGDLKTEKSTLKNKKEKVSFGFYSSLLLLIVFFIAFSRILYFSQDLIVTKLPVTEFYLNYYFENLRNIFEIWKDLITY